MLIKRRLLNNEKDKNKNKSCNISLFSLVNTSSLKIFQKRFLYKELKNWWKCLLIYLFHTGNIFHDSSEISR